MKMFWQAAPGVDALTAVFYASQPNSTIITTNLSSVRSQPILLLLSVRKVVTHFILYVQEILTQFTVCQRSSDPFYIVSYYIKWVTTVCPRSSTPILWCCVGSYILSYYIKWVTTSWTYSNKNITLLDYVVLNI